MKIVVKCHFNSQRKDSNEMRFLPKFFLKRRVPKFVTRIFFFKWLALDTIQYSITCTLSVPAGETRIQLSSLPVETNYYKKNKVFLKYTACQKNNCTH